MAQPRLKFWGWGHEGDAPAPDEVRWLEGMWAQQFRVRQFELTPPPTADEIHLRPSRLSIPAPLLPICIAMELPSPTRCASSRATFPILRT